MKISIIHWICVSWIFLLSTCSGATEDDIMNPVGQEREHPFLIVKAEQFESLRQSAFEEPWTSIKADAISRSDAGIRTGSSNSQNAYDLQYYIGAAALAYILDVDRAQLHANRVRNAILDQYSKLDLSEDRDWGGVVPNLGSFFVAILSLDIVYNALSAAEIQKCEQVISDQIFKLKREGSWADVRRGTHGTWDIYQGTRTGPDDAYYEGVMQQITEDGVSPVTIHYAWERVGGGDSRISKSGYMDVLEFTGIDRRYYQNERLQKFQRWLFGSSVNTAKEMAIIGDMLPTQNLNNDMLHRRVVNFDEAAAGYAAWFYEGRPARGNILTYILPQKALPAPVVPQSQWYRNGGAFFRERPDDPNGLHAVLYNISSQDEWHTHQEVNGLALSGFGNRLLVNGGRLGAPTRPAALNNTLTINGVEHASRLGDGILEGFTTDQLDYACGSAGPALPGRSHLRNLLLVHADATVPAFSVVLDEVETTPGEQVHNYFHPANESSLEESTLHQVYRAVIDHYPSAPGANLSFFFANPPQAINIKKVPSAVPDRYPNYPEHNRIEAIYPADRNPEVPIITVLFPHHNSQSLPVFSQIRKDDFSGGVMAYENGVVDYLFASSGVQDHTHEDATFQAKSVLFRQKEGRLDFFFLNQGQRFAFGAFTLETETPVSIYFNDNKGVILSPGTDLILKGPGVQNIQFDPPATILRQETDLLEVKVPKGSFKFE